MAITVTNLGSSAAPDFEDNADATSYANASWTPPSAADCIILLWVYNTKATTLGVAGTVTGNSLTWTQQATVGTDPGAQTHRLTLYAAISTGTAATGQTTVDYAGVTQSSIIMEFQQVTGVDLSTGLAGAIVQEPTNSSNAAVGISVNLSAAGDANNRPVAGVGHGQPEEATERSLWTELDDINGTSPGHALETQWRDDAFETTASASWTTSGAALIIAAEIKAKAGTTYDESVEISRVNAISPVESLMVLIAKGYSIARDFAASIITSSFKSSTPSTSDFTNSTTTSDTTSGVSTSDSSPSVEVEDL